MLPVNIDKAGIYAYVTTLTSQIGRSRKEYDRFVCSPDNYPVLDRFMDAAVSETEAQLHRHLAGSYDFTLSYSSGEPGASVVLQLLDYDDRLRPSVRGSLSTQIRLAVAFMLTGMWLQPVDAEVSQVYSAGAVSYLRKAVELVIQRTPSVTDSSYRDPGQEERMDSGTDAVDGMNGSVSDDSEVSPGADFLNTMQDSVSDSSHVGGSSGCLTGFQDAAVDCRIGDGGSGMSGFSDGNISDSGRIGGGPSSIASPMEPNEDDVIEKECPLAHAVFDVNGRLLRNVHGSNMPAFHAAHRRFRK